MVGYNTLLYTCSLSNSNYMIVNYLITEAGADQDSMNDYSLSWLLIATKKVRLDSIELLLHNDNDIDQVDWKGCIALHIMVVIGLPRHLADDPALQVEGLLEVKEAAEEC